MKKNIELVKNNEVIYSDRVINKAKTQILKIIDQICSENNLEYFAFATTLVGCVHYQSFIPNKSSTSGDIGLVRSDYEKLISILKDHAEEYGLIYDDHVGSSPIPQKIVRVGILITAGDFEEYKDEVTVTGNFWILISPFDQMPDGFDLYCAHLRRMKRANKIFEIICSTWKYNKNNQSFFKFFIKKILFGWRNPQKQYDKIQKLAQKYNGKPHCTRYIRTVGSKTEFLWENQLYPIKKMPFNDMQLSCPNDYTQWTEKMTPELEKQIKTIQKVDLILLKEFDRICRKLNIGYFICGGSMLGYVRHGGFIPWDDDVDVGMLRADYDRFIKEGAKELDTERFFLQTRESDPKIPYLFSKIRMNNTSYITEYNENRDFHKGICLDLFPFDAIPNDENERDAFLAKVYVKVRKHNKACNKQIAEPIYDFKPETFEDWFYRKFAFLHRQCWRMVSIKKTQKKYIKIATKYNEKADELGYTSVASFVPTYTFIEKEDLLPYKDIKFEGVDAKVPNKPEVFLEMQYHDFMELPQVHQQLGHDLIHWSADIPELGEDRKA